MDPSDLAAVQKITGALPEFTERIARCLAECGPLETDEIVSKLSGDAQALWVDLVMRCRANRGLFSRHGTAWCLRVTTDGE